MDLDKALETAKKAAVKAGVKILKYYSKPVKIAEKTEGDYVSPLTEADLKANKIIVKALGKFKIPVLTEEGKDDKQRLISEYVWIVDPLDGTKEFIKKNDEFTVNIALVRNGRPVLGVIYVPVKKDLYYAVEGKGTVLENKSGSAISVSEREQYKELVLVKSRSHASEHLTRIIEQVDFADILTSGSSVKGCMVAKGIADVYIRLGPINEWDICAMDIIVFEAGGKMTDLAGQIISYNKQTTLITSGFMVSNNTVHSKLLDSVRSAL